MFIKKNCKFHCFEFLSEPIPASTVYSTIHLKVLVSVNMVKIVIIIMITRQIVCSGTCRCSEGRYDE